MALKSTLPIFCRMILIKNAKLWDGVSPVHDGAVLVFHDKVMRTGKTEELLNDPHVKNAHVIDANFCTVMPAFTDVHVHLTEYARNALNLDVSRARSKHEMINMLKEYAENVEPDKWIKAVRLNEQAWEDKTFPTRKELDVIKQPLIIFRMCYHIVFVNSATLSKFDAHEFDNVEGAVMDENGELTGLFEEGSSAPIKALYEKEALDDDAPELYKSYQNKFNELLAYGVAEVHAISAQWESSKEQIYTYQRFKENNDLPIRVVLYQMEIPSNPRMSSFYGDDWILYGGLKVFLDGSIGGRTAAVRTPYLDTKKSGMMIHTDEELYDIIKEATLKDIQVMAHSIGDAAIEQHIRVLEKLIQEGVKFKHPVKFTHVQVFQPDLIERAKKLPIICDIQPGHLTNYEAMDQIVGLERSKYCSPLRSLIDAGIIVAGSSDCPVIPADPIVGIHIAVNRTSPGEDHCYTKEQCISLDEALQLYTINAQKLIQRDDKKGTLTPGMKADIVILDHDLFGIDPKAIASVRVNTTIVDGKVAYQKV